jgi:acetyl esterase/lipase
VEFSHRMHEALKKAGAPVKLTVYPGVGHDSWTQTYDDPAFWQWLLAQKRP